MKLKTRLEVERGLSSPSSWTGTRNFQPWTVGLIKWLRHGRLLPLTTLANVLTLDSVLKILCKSTRCLLLTSRLQKSQEREPKNLQKSHLSQAGSIWLITARFRKAMIWPRTPSVSSSSHPSPQRSKFLKIKIWANSTLLWVRIVIRGLRLTRENPLKQRSKSQGCYPTWGISSQRTVSSLTSNSFPLAFWSMRVRKRRNLAEMNSATSS